MAARFYSIFLSVLLGIHCLISYVRNQKAPPPLGSEPASSTMVVESEVDPIVRTGLRPG